MVPRKHPLFTTVAPTKAAPQMAQKTAADRKAADSMAKRQGERSEQTTLNGSAKYSTP